MSYTLTTPDQINAFQLITLKLALKLASKGIKANGQWTNRRGLDTASRYTGQTYRNSKAELLRAADDLDAIINPKA